MVRYQRGSVVCTIRAKIQYIFITTKFYMFFLAEKRLTI